MLSLNDFKNLIKVGSLFAIDLIVKNEEGKILLGLRKNSPAKDYWFIPGGRIYKNETLSEGFERITMSELGVAVNIDEIKPFGLFDHIYHDNFFDEKDFGTHYIVFTCEVLKKIKESDLPKGQHSDYKFILPEELLNHSKVHQFTKNYFVKEPSNLFLKF